MSPDLVSTAGREHYILELPDWSSWPERLELAKPNFVLFVAGDSTGASDSEVSAFAALALGQGALHTIAWGPGCREVDTAFDLVQVQAEVASGEAGPHIMTSSHAGESFAEAVWVSLFCAWPDPDWEDTPFCWLGVLVNEPARARDLRGWLSEPESLLRILGLGD